MHVLLKLLKLHLHSRLSDSSLENLMKVAIEGPPIKNVDFHAIMDIFKQKIGVLNFYLNNYKNKKYVWKILGGKGSLGGGYPSASPPLYESMYIYIIYI